MEQANSQRVELVVSDQSQLGLLQDLVNRAAPDAGVSRIARGQSAGELGSLDLLAIVASSSGVLAAIRVLPEFLRSRKTGLSITMTLKGEPFTLTATNIDDAMVILERLLDA
jgi:hypothetical protein